MKRVLAVILTGFAIGAFTAHAKLPPPTDAEKAAAAAKKEKDAAQKVKDADTLSKAQDRAVANYKKTKGMSMSPSKPANSGKK